MTLWAITIASGIDPHRLATVMRSWAVAVDGACVVLGPDDPEPHGLPYPLRIVRTNHPFGRASWRNIAARFAPADRLVSLDADCVILDPEKSFRQRTLEALGEEGSRRLAAYTFSWGEAVSVDHILAGGALDKALWSSPGCPTTGATGQFAFWQKDLIEVSWNDEMVGWGYEDADLHWRATGAGFTTAWLMGLLGHVYHPARADRTKQNKRQNVHRAIRRAEGVPSIERAVREISMVPLAHPLPEASGGEPAIRRAVRQLVEREGWPALDELRRGYVPAGCLYEPVLATRHVVDSTTP